MAEGSAYKDLTSTPVVIGGYSSDCTKRVATFWDVVGLETTTVSDPTSAELTKLADNWWIDLNIALANEVALLSEQLGADALEVIEAANTLEKGDGTVNILYPGAGVGGSCLVKDPWFVANLGAQHDLELETPKISRRVNERMPEHVVSLVRETLSGLSGERIAVLGYAFKGGTDDTRNTPAKQIIDDLSESNAELRVTDPYVSDSTIREETGLEPLTLSSALADVSSVVIVTGHDSFRALDPAALIGEVGHEEFSVVDGRHVFDPDAFAETNVTYVGIGRGRDD